MIRSHALLLLTALAVLASTTVKVDQNSNRGELRVRTGDTLALMLEENPTTGYRWEVKSSGEPVCSLTKTDFHAASGHLTGRGGERHWLFRIVKPGSAALELSYRRPFEREQSPARTFRVIVRAAN